MLISGKTIANYILENASQRIQQLWSEKHIQPHIGVIQVGDNPASSSYIAQKKKTAEKIGAELSLYKLPEDVPQEKLLETIDFLQHKDDKTIHGLLVQLPLPPHIDKDIVLNSIDLDKDIDGFRKDSPFQVPVALAIIHILATIWQVESTTTRNANLFPLDPRLHQWLSEKHILIIGQGFTAGKPIADLLKKEELKPDIIDISTPNPDIHIKNADLIISCAGHPKLLNKDNLTKDIILLGVGISRGEDGEVHGDYEVPAIESIASYFTPTIGGVGPVNVACLMANLVTAAEKSAK